MSTETKELKLPEAKTLRERLIKKDGELLHECRVEFQNLVGVLEGEDASQVANAIVIERWQREELHKFLNDGR